VRRFSKRSHLVTLSDINVTPLLDLAWVLLIIFVITTPLLERSVDLKLPEGGAPTRVDRRDIQTVEIDAAGRYTSSTARRSSSTLWRRPLWQRIGAIPT